MPLMLVYCTMPDLLLSDMVDMRALSLCDLCVATVATDNTAELTSPCIEVFSSTCWLAQCLEWF